MLTSSQHSILDLLEHSSDGIALVVPGTWRVVFTNSTLAQWAGETAVGRPIDEVLSGITPDELEQRLASIWSGESECAVIPVGWIRRSQSQSDVPVEIRAANVQIGDERQVEAAQQQIISLLRQRHNIRPGRDDDFTVRTQQEIAEAATATSRVMTFLLGAIAGVSLLVGGIGIMNIMLVSVTERTREIGVRMAVGARGNDILTQFLIEAVTLSSVGGIIGIICGIGASALLSTYAHWPTLISIGSIAIAFLFSAAVGVFFGFYPARKAAALDPIEALRYE